MDAPKGKYRVEEKDGRLVVIDNATGAPTPSSLPPPRAGGPGLPPGPVVAGKGALDTVADFLLAMAVREWDGEGRAVIAWEWKQNGRPKRWDARLDQGQQRRLGRALLGLSTLPLLLLIFIFAGAIGWLALPVALAPALWGVATILRLQSETAGQALPDD